MSSSSMSAASSSSVDPKKVEPSTMLNFNVTEPTMAASQIKTYEGTSWTDEPSIELKGTSTANFEKLTVLYMPSYGDARDVDTYEVKGFKTGDTQWRYVASTTSGNLKSGINEYDVRMYAKDGTYVEKKYLVSYYTGESSSSSVAPGAPLDIAWAQPQKLDTLKYLKDIGEYDRTYRKLKLEWELNGEKEISEWTTQTYAERIAEGMEYYKVGTVSTGDYAGSDVILAVIDLCLGVYGPCFERFIPQDYVKTKEGFIRFNAVTNAWFASTYDTKHSIDVGTPFSLKMPGGEDSLKFIEAQGFRSSFGPQAFVSTETGQPVYSDANSCFAAKRADGTTAIYDIDISKYMADDGTLSFTANDGKTLSDAYLVRPFRGCSSRVFCFDAVSMNDVGAVPPSRPLEKIGTFKGGQIVYREKYSATEIAGFSGGVTSGDLSSVYAGLPNWEGTPKIPTPQAFYDSYPVIYIKDSLGRYLRFQKEKYEMGAECGKPVIYLYPTKEQDVNVQVKPVGGLTVSDPAYGHGWNVRATPKSEIYNYADGKKYGYLFWEGDGGEYEQAKEGFVVKRSEVHQFMLEKLNALGLNSIETADFLEFWEPKLTKSSWVFITFVPQSQFETMAPLTVTPTPDTVIRVFMDYSPLDAPKSVPPQKLSAPEREGFTVVEWGGVLHSGDAKDDLIYQSVPLR